MDIQSLKQYIYDNHKIEYVLEKLGCHNIKHNAKHDYYSAAQKDGDNPMGVVINNNRYLNYISYSRNVTPEQHKDIVDLVQSTNKIDFVDALKWLHGIFDLDFSICSKPKKIITDDDDDCDKSMSTTYKRFKKKNWIYTNQSSISNGFKKASCRGLQKNLDYVIHINIIE